MSSQNTRPPTRVPEVPSAASAIIVVGLLTLSATVLPIFYAHKDDSFRKFSWMEAFLVLQSLGYLAFTIALLHFIKTFGKSPQCNEQAFILLALRQPSHLNNPELAGKEYFISLMTVVIFSIIGCLLMGRIIEVCRSVYIQGCQKAIAHLRL